MQQLFFGLAVLACPVGMGLMMWMMMRGRGKGDDSANRGGADASEQQQLRRLREEINALEADRADRREP